MHHCALMKERRSCLTHCSGFFFLGEFSFCTSKDEIFKSVFNNLFFFFFKNFNSTNLLSNSQVKI